MIIIYFEYSKTKCVHKVTYVFKKKYYFYFKMPSFVGKTDIIFNYIAISEFNKKKLRLTKI